MDVTFEVISTVSSDQELRLWYVFSSAKIAEVRCFVHVPRSFGVAELSEMLSFFLSLGIMHPSHGRGY